MQWSCESFTTWGVIQTIARIQSLPSSPEDRWQRNNYISNDWLVGNRTHVCVCVCVCVYLSISDCCTNVALRFHTDHNVGTPQNHVWFYTVRCGLRLARPLSCALVLHATCSLPHFPVSQLSDEQPFATGWAKCLFLSDSCFLKLQFCFLYLRFLQIFKSFRCISAHPLSVLIKAWGSTIFQCFFPLLYSLYATRCEMRRASGHSFVSPQKRFLSLQIMEWGRQLPFSTDARHHWSQYAWFFLQLTDTVLQHPPGDAGIA